MRKIYTLLSGMAIAGALFAQPVLVKDINPGSDDAYPTGFCIYNGKVYFNATSPDTSASVPQQELWVSDGTAGGTKMVHDLPASGGGSTQPYALTVCNGKLMYIGWTVGGQQIWQTDGTDAGTKVVITASFYDVFSGSNNNLLKYGNDVYVRAVENNQGTSGIYKTNGTVPGTKKLSATLSPSGYPTEGTDMGGSLYLYAGITNDWGIVKTDGTAAGTSEVMPFGSMIYSNMVALNGNIYFISDTSMNGNYELWKTDGTLAGTKMVKDIKATGSITNTFEHLVTDSQFVYFWADDGSNGLELWKSDGTAGGTAMVKDVTPGGSSMVTGLMVKLNGKMLFTTYDNTKLKHSLWASDGTSAGTLRIKDSLDMPLSPDHHSYDTLNRELIFADGEFIWATDGTAAGTRLLAKTDNSNGPALVDELICNNELILMSIYDTTSGTELWKMDYVPPVHIGLSDASTLEQVQVYPNPFNGELQLETGAADIASIAVYSVAGQEVFRSAVSKGHQTFSTPSLVPGLYFYQVTAASGAVKTGKLVRQ